mmetsp:Transcript_3058/g.6878  ORF Transcript_3058/g.6878 Transcript_3058/m.6878 type:complete len:274 (+) Transcript_3058:94-915(+)
MHSSIVRDDVVKSCTVSVQITFNVGVKPSKLHHHFRIQPVRHGQVTHGIPSQNHVVAAFQYRPQAVAGLPQILIEHVNQGLTKSGEFPFVIPQQHITHDVDILLRPLLEIRGELLVQHLPNHIAQAGRKYYHGHPQVLGQAEDLPGSVPDRKIRAIPHAGRKVCLAQILGQHQVVGRPVPLVHDWNLLLNRNLGVDFNREILLKDLLDFLLVFIRESTEALHNAIASRSIGPSLREGSGHGSIKIHHKAGFPRLRSIYSTALGLKIFWSGDHQ